MRADPLSHFVVERLRRREIERRRAGAHGKPFREPGLARPCPTEHQDMSAHWPLLSPPTFAQTAPRGTRLPITARLGRKSAPETGPHAAHAATRLAGRNRLHKLLSPGASWHYGPPAFHGPGCPDERV